MGEQSTFFLISLDNVGNTRIEEANKESLLMYDAMDLTLLRQLYNAHGLELSLGTTSRNLYLLGKLAANGWGVEAIIPKSACFNCTA